MDMTHSKARTVADRRRLTDLGVPGFSPVVVWDSPTDSVAALVPDGLTGAPPTPTSRALETDPPDVSSGEVRSTVSVFGGLVGIVAWWFLAVPHLRGTPMWVALIVAAIAGAAVAGFGLDARRRATLQARRKAWQDYRDELDPVLSRVVRVDEEVVDVVEVALLQHRRTAAEVTPWPDLGSGLPDIPATSARLLHAHLVARTEEEQQESHELGEIDAILALAPELPEDENTVSIENEDLVRLRARRRKLLERARRRRQLVDETREQLSTEQELARHLQATALARTHNSRSQEPAPAGRN